MPAIKRVAAPLVLTVALALGACGSQVAGNQRGGIGYSAKLPTGSVILGSPAGKLPEGGEAVSLKVGQSATITAANQATPDFQTAYRMVSADPTVVQVAGDAVAAKQAGITTVAIQAVGGRSLTYCLKENAASCNLLNITVTP